jgi:hypothetical protein
VPDSVKDFDRDALGGEVGVAPSAGDRCAGLEWKPAAVPPDDIWVFGATELPWLDLARAVGFRRNQLAYAHAYVFSPRGGPARVVVEHGHGLKAWVNGREVYCQPQRDTALGWYTQISNHELYHLDQPSPRFDLTLRKGWNRLLLKLSTSNRVDFTDMRCCLRLLESPGVRYETRTSCGWRPCRRAAPPRRSSSATACSSWPSRTSCCAWTRTRAASSGPRPPTTTRR